MIYLDRHAWGATVPTAGYSMRLPAIGVHVHHSVTIADDDHDLLDTGDVIADMREIELIGKRRFGRFPYSYCIHPSGVVAEGAGTTVGAHTENWNSTTFGVCFIGNYEHDPLADAQVQAYGELWRHLVATRRLRADAGMLPHRHRKATACPGAHVMARWGDLVAATPEPSAPIPAPIDYGSFDMATAQTLLVHIALDGDGNGWTYAYFPFVPTRVVGVVAHDAHPLGDDLQPGGVGPNADRGYNPNRPPRYTAAIYDGRVLVTARDGAPGGHYSFWVTAA